MTKKFTKQVTSIASTIVRHDSAHCLTPGLFRSIKRGEREHRNLNITYKYSDDEKIRFIGYQPLGVDDMRVLQGLVFMAGQSSVALPPEPETDIQKRMYALLKTEHDMLDQEALIAKGRISTLIADIGMQKSGQAFKRIKDSLIRMSTITIFTTKGSLESAFHLLSYVLDKSDGKLIVALNPLITGAIIGHQRYTRIDMEEVRTLKTDPARLIHQRLCGWINLGGQGRITLGTICGYIWPEENSNENTIKYRKRIAQKAIVEISGLGWNIEEYALQKYQITRSVSPKK